MCSLLIEIGFLLKKIRLKVNKVPRAKGDQSEATMSFHQYYTHAHTYLCAHSMN